jgi:hypothetical protein
LDTRNINAKAAADSHFGDRFSSKGTHWRDAIIADGKLHAIASNGFTSSFKSFIAASICFAQSNCSSANGRHSSVG